MPKSRECVAFIGPWCILFTKVPNILYNHLACKSSREGFQAKPIVVLQNPWEHNGLSARDNGTKILIIKYVRVLECLYRVSKLFFLTSFTLWQSRPAEFCYRWTVDRVLHQDRLNIGRDCKSVRCEGTLHD